MPRQERPLESEDTPLLAFAGDLRRLRRQAGLPTYRELGRRSSYSPAALSEALSGRRLPSLAVTLAVVRACGGDTDEWTRRWRTLAATQPDAGGAVPMPYVGLAPYQVNDADRFFGREALTQTLLELVEERPFVGVFGSSGAGKSSLVRAGLVARGRRTALIVTPGSDPVTEVAVVVAGQADVPAHRVRQDLVADPESLRGWLLKATEEPLLVVDQFEEVFTLCDEAARLWLITALTAAAGPQSRVVVCVRADFYGHCARYPELLAALHRAQVMVGPMSAEELRSAITEPAARVGATAETALVTRLVSDVGAEPAALPLVSHTLAETWRRRRGVTLTLAGYQDVGGIEHALSRTAERTFEDLTADGRTAARQLFLRMVVAGDGTEDTKRRVRRGDLTVPSQLLERLAAARLITIDRDSVELTHEALLRAWPRLAGWIDDSRDELRTQQRLAEATEIWEAHERDPDTLYRGARLEQAERLRAQLNARERAFLDAGLTAERARVAAGRQIDRRLRRLVAGLTALAVLLAAVAGVAVRAQRAATGQRNETMSLRAADAARDLLTARPRDAAALALAGYRVSPTAHSRDMLALAAAAAEADTLGDGFLMPPGSVALTYEYGSGAGVVHHRLWRRVGTTWRRAARLADVRSFPYLSSTDRRRVVYRDGTVSYLWDFADPDRPRRISVPPELAMVDSMDAAGSLLGGVDDGRSAYVWRVGDRSARRLAAPDVVSTAVLADGSGIVLGRHDGGQDTVEWWALDGRRSATLARIPHLASLVAGPAGLVAAVSGVGQLTVVDAADPDAPRLLDGGGGLSDPAEIAFDPAGQTVAVVHPGGARLLDVRAGRRLLDLHTQGLRLAAPRVRGTVLDVVDPDGAVWHLDSDVAATIRRVCAEPVSVDWEQYFPGIRRRPCVGR